MYTMKHLHPYNKSLLLHHILVLYNHTKNHTLMFQRGVLKDLNRQGIQCYKYSDFFISISNNFL